MDDIYNAIWLTITGSIILLYEYKILPFRKEKRPSGIKAIKFLGFAFLLAGIFYILKVLWSWRKP